MAAKRKIFRTPKIKAKNSLLFVIVAILAFVALIVWAVIAQSPGKTPHAAAAIPEYTFTWDTNRAYFRYTVCLAGTTQCQPYKEYITTNSALVPLAQSVHYDLHVEIGRSDGWYGWENTQDFSIVCGFAMCNKFLSWTNAKYIINTSIDNMDHLVDFPTHSYTYYNVPYNLAISGGVSYNDFGGMGSNHTVQTFGGNTGPPPTPACWVDNSVVAGNNVQMSSYNDLSGDVRIIKTDAPDGTPSTYIGYLNSTQPTSGQFLGPILVPAGNYIVRVGGFGVRCTNSSGDVLTVSAPPNTCWSADVGVGEDGHADGKISILDISAIAQVRGSHVGDARYQVRLDLDRDGYISILDISRAATYFGRSC